MARYTEAVCRLCRREGQKLFLKGDRCYTKCALENRSYAPVSYTHLDVYKRQPTIPQTSLQQPCRVLCLCATQLR